MDEPRAPQLAPGRRLGRYRVERVLGTGGMGAVYAAVHLKTGRAVALKVMHAVRGPDATRRFLREARAATAIKHPNVIQILDWFEDDDGTPVLVMERLEGETLRAHRQREGPMPLSRVASLMVPVVSAVAAAHERGVVHRDLKPDNVFLAREAGGALVPKVLDFGIAKVLRQAESIGDTHATETRDGALLGTPQYMSYEQAMGDRPVDQRADVWSIGVILFELLVGRRPIEFASIGKMYEAMFKNDIAHVRETLPDLPVDVADAIDGCLAIDPDHRPASLQPLLDVLSAHAGEPISAAVVQPLVRRRYGRWVALVIVLAIVVAGGALARPKRARDGVAPPAVTAAGPSATASTTATSASSAAETAPAAGSAAEPDDVQVTPDQPLPEPSTPAPQAAVRRKPPAPAESATPAAKPPRAGGLATSDPYR